jgi:hypothetical protein
LKRSILLKDDEALKHDCEKASSSLRVINLFKSEVDTFKFTILFPIYRKKKVKLLWRNEWSRDYIKDLVI